MPMHAAPVLPFDESSAGDVFGDSFLYFTTPSPSSIFEVGTYLVHGY